MTITDIANINWKNGIDWCPDIETGHEQIDGQHRHIFKLLGDLVEECENKKNINTLKILNFLADYVVEHFADEEALQRQSKYPKFEWHREQHQFYINEFKKLNSEFAANGNSPKFTLDMNNTVISWIVRHIKSADVELGKFLNANRGA